MTDRVMRVDAGEWVPDQPPYNNPGVLSAKNCVPQAIGYRSMQGLRPFATALGGGDIPVGAYWAQNDDFTTVNLAGTADALYQLVGATWSDVSKAGGYSGISSWEFALFGYEVIAVAPGQAPQVIDLAAGSPQFADLAGNPPNAKRVGVVRDFVVFGDIDSEENYVYWSAPNNATIWRDPIEQADYQLFPEFGRVQRVVPGAVGYIFQENAIQRMDYVGGNIIFTFNAVERGRGAYAPESVCWVGDRVFFYAQDGFFMLQGGQTAPIGEERVNRWFIDNAAPSKITEMRGVVDKANRVVLWAFKSSNASTYADRLLIYNYSVNKWAWAELETIQLTEYRSVGYSLDGLASVLTNIDQGSIPVDSTAYKGGALSLISWDSTGTSNTLSGDPLTAELVTAEIGGGGGRRLSVNGVRPLYDGDDRTLITIQTGGRNSFSDPVSFKQAVNVTARGQKAPVRDDRRMLRLKTVIDGGFEHFMGWELNAQPGGLI